jgi:glycosyltransferase involved in cell wall biosynthesis
MKVLVLTNMYPSDQHVWSGIFVREQIEDLEALGVDIELMVIEGRRSRLNYLRGLRELRGRLTRTRVDLVHAHYGLTGAIALGQRDAPVVTTFHGGDIHVRWQSTVSWVVARRSVPIFVSEVGRRALSKRDGVVIPTGVDTVRFHPRSIRAARDSLGWSHDSRYVLFPGARRNPIKCVCLFEEAVNVAREREPGLQTAYLEDLSRDEVATVMNAADVTLLTSTNEGSPVAVRESLATTTPVVSVPVGDMSSLLAGLPGCAVEARDPGRLADGVLTALRVGKRSELRDRAAATSRERTAERVLTVYEEVVGRTRSRSGANPSGSASQSG